MGSFGHYQSQLRVCPPFALLQAWQRRRMDLINVLKNASGILFQIRINTGPYPLTSQADFADDVTVVPFYPRRAQWAKDRMKRITLKSMSFKQNCFF